MPPVTLRPIEIRDWQRIHEWASTEAACRFQPWGPNSLADSEQFVADALVAWQQETIRRRVWAAEADGPGLVGLGELAVTSAKQARRLARLQSLCARCRRIVELRCGITAQTSIAGASLLAMTSWRDTTTQPVQDDLDALVTLAVDHAHYLLKKNGEFFPFGVAMSDEGEDYFFSADPGLGKHPESQLVLDLLYDVAAAAKEGNRAVGFVADVTFNGVDEVRIETDHRDDATGLVFMVPYQRKGLLKKSVAYGKMRTHMDARLVWTD